MSFGSHVYMAINQVISIVYELDVPANTTKAMLFVLMHKEKMRLLSTDLYSDNQDIKN